VLSTKLFESGHFYRRQCPICKSYFWTKRADQVYCGDQPCVPYGFIGNSPVRAAVDNIRDLRERFLSFFERRGHARIRRYPVVARWRDDVFLVGAYIRVIGWRSMPGMSPRPPRSWSWPTIRNTPTESS